MHASPRVVVRAGRLAVQVVLPGAVGTGQAAWLEANYVTLVLTAQFLFTVHTAPSAPLQHARHQYCGLDDAHTRADGGRLLFQVTDVLIGSFRPQLLALDDRMGENTKNVREQAKDALSHYSEAVAGRQAQVINALTIVATVFLPLSFFTGYFGMNFRILTADLQTTLWQFILLGLLLPLASAALSLLLIHRLVRRLGLRRMDEPSS